MLKLIIKKSFQKDYTRHFKNKDITRAMLDAIVSQLQQQVPLEAKHRDHALKGQWKEFRECHVKPDLLLIYQVQDDALILIRLGTHSELF
ncbi:type II toxin-antitoxin system RelE/ParE family toxin [Helicobacter suis]|uniref:type II toxin-antitoxin system RelE/ParE family toxin n=1 Tax=Helicobacter suis TaxID=104628 RepID=UPI0013D85186|nr:type II toxin-antitoxin system YafQ family toxin [Helicobacter suis]